MSASIISSSIYFLWRITTFPEIGNVDALLIGAAVTCALFLGGWGIASGRGNPVESSLLVSSRSVSGNTIGADVLLVRLHHFVHLPDFYRLSTLNSGQRFSSGESSSTATITTYHHGFLYNPHPSLF